MKKILLLASMALALVAFAAPAAQAQAPLWYHGDDVDPITGVEALHITGELSSTIIGGGGLVSGPCEVTFEGTAENVNGMAHGTITGGEIQEHCETNVEGCIITPTLSNFPWTVTGTTVTGQKGIEIATPTFTNHYGAGCPVPPVGPISAVGIATGRVELASGCVTFDEHTDDMFLETAGLPALQVDILGTVCDTTLQLG